MVGIEQMEEQMIAQDGADQRVEGNREVDGGGKRENKSK